MYWKAISSSNILCGKLRDDVWTGAISAMYVLKGHYRFAKPFVCQMFVVWNKICHMNIRVKNHSWIYNNICFQIYNLIYQVYN